MKIAVLPMDNRPPNYQFLERLADMFQVNLILPAKEKLGYYMEPAPANELGNWIIKQEADVYIVSVEMLIYGGLIASREKGITTKECHSRMKKIPLLKNKHPKSKIYLSSIVRRASVSTFSEESQYLWDKVNAYFKAIAIDDKYKASEISKEMPSGFIDEYISLRNRNHEINKKAIELTSQEYVDTLVLAQEDTFEKGPQQKELEVLEEMAGDLLNERIFIHNGADEVCQELLVRANVVPNKLRISYDSPETAKKVMGFEDRPFQKNISSHLQLCRLKKDSLAERSLLVAGTNVNLALKKLDKEYARCRDVGMLDIIKPNGGIIDLINSVGLGRLSSLYAYSAWNTASNSLGTALAMMSLQSPDVFEEKARIKFLLERFLDDYLYQGIFRNELESELRKIGGDPFHVSKTPDTLENFKKHYLDEVYKKLLTPLFDSKLIPYKIGISKFELPWDRTFECEVELLLTNRNNNIIYPV